MEIVAILAVIAAVAAAVGTLVASNAKQKAAAFNEDASKKEAQAVAQQAAFDAENQRQKNRRLFHAQRAAFAASGLDPDSGSALDVQNSSSIEGEMDALVSIYTGKSAANAANARAQLFAMERKSAKTAGKIGAVGSLLGSTSIAASNPGF
jgi:hypothetical protein